MVIDLSRLTNFSWTPNWIFWGHKLNSAFVGCDELLAYPNGVARDGGEVLQ
jgi:hypothetical protein